MVLFLKYCALKNTFYSNKIKVYIIMRVTANLITYNQFFFLHIFLREKHG